ncbi:MAG TPA: hypothetical protein VJJ70_09270 [Anaerolineales bacterium]|nr:hypothetical protein [Anaerolineales bacterium]
MPPRHPVSDSRLLTFEQALSAKERRLFRSFDSPACIQAFLDSIPYSADPRYRCPLNVLRDRKAHCYDGALLAIVALRRLGRRPMLVDMLAWRDDDHMLAVYREDGHYGAVAKSNFVGLRYRDPIYRSLRELVISYFEGFYNMEGYKSLRAYTRPLDLVTLDHLDWMRRDAAMDVIAEKLEHRARTRVVDRHMVARLAPIDRRAFRAGMLGAVRAGIYFPPKARKG